MADEFVRILSLPTRSALLMLLFAATVTGCQTPSLKAGQDFVAAANALAQAESDYFDPVQVASDASHLLIAGANYVARNGAFANVASGLSKKDDFSKAKALRMAVMAQLQNYAQQVAAIMTEAGGTWVADDAKAVTSNVDTLLTDIGAVKISQQQAGLIQTAVTNLAQAIVNNMAADELQSLAKQARRPIADIAVFIAQDHANIEADNFASGLALDQTTSMMNMLHAIYEDKSVHSAERFAALMEWRDWKPALVTKGSDIDAATEEARTSE